MDARRYVCSQINSLNNTPSSLLYNAANTHNIGVLGHSFGGATAINFCLTQTVCKAGVDIDGSPYGIALQQPAIKPFLYITHDYKQQCSLNCREIQQLYANTSAPAYAVSIKGTNHLNFSDEALQYAFPIDFSGNFGSIDRVKALEMSGDFLVNFFDKYLKNNASPLLVHASKYPEVSLVSKP